MSKKKKWWQQSSYKSLADQFPNTAKQHQSKGAPKSYYDYEDYDDDGFDDWGRNLGKKENKSNYADVKTKYSSDYGKYEKTGYWGGYNSYRAPQLSYKYVQQMANALAGQHNITLEVGNTWEVDLIKKKLKYDPSSLIYGTKSELLATLLHEIGKLRYMEHYTTLNSKYLAMYKESAAEAFFPFEDVRVDYQMLRAYESAAELYESAIPGVQKQIEVYKKYASAFKKASVLILKNVYQEILNTQVSDPHEYSIRLMQTFGTNDLSKVQERISEISKYYRENGCLFDYCADMLHVMYDLETPTTGFKNITEKVEASVPFIEPIKHELTSQGAVDIMETGVYPLVEDLMKDLNNKKEELQKMIPGMVDAVARQLADMFRRIMESEVGNPSNPQGNAPTPNAKKDGVNGIRGGSGPSNSRIPLTWAEGDYKALKESVDPEIKALVHKLTFLRREEMTVKYEANQKRGKLNSRKLVKFAFGSRRLFKQKLPNIDTVQSFAFSVLMDISGSMAGPRAIHTTRAMVMFNEVFKKLNIPFELVAFGDSAKTIKKFDSPADKNMELSIGGLVKANGGGTNLDQGLEELKIQSRPETNKIVIVLTDGGVGDARRFDNEYFRPWKDKHNIKSLAFGLELSDYEKNEMRKLCENTGKVVESANQLPIEFAELLKSIIKRKK